MASLPRMYHALLAAFAGAVIAVPMSGMARPAAVPAPAPAHAGPLPPATAGALADRYAASREDIRAAERMASAHGDLTRAAALRAMAEPDRSFLTFDGRDGGRTVEVFGDLAQAERIAVLVPGSDTDLDRYGRLESAAAALVGQLGDKSAVIAWLGYATPSTISLGVLTTGRADEATGGLRRFVEELRAVKPAARTSLVCHSYGTVVCARAAADMAVSDIVLLGSPGTGYDTVAELHTPATVWAGRGATDWIANVPHFRLRFMVTTIGFGPDPLSPGFGARVFDAGTGGHSDYLKPGSSSLAGIARIISGDTHDTRS
ncbi:alpha/beta hydrolase [Actinocrispum wychmicini]|uniref:Alpha/beta hydrolase family protein n=1 Tax=Actinocrispum wychmicini TaxID=1213861 RepID=A0A4R2JPV8_9PSEU|nr:alpha/beta hydrolase [Actinocrispum wychmicini]TCO62223.1 alpha/beta hydrolase family protein [Actinocrispum wychmicini]